MRFFSYFSILVAVQGQLHALAAQFEAPFWADCESALLEPSPKHSELKDNSATPQDLARYLFENPRIEPGSDYGETSDIVGEIAGFSAIPIPSIESYYISFDINPSGFAHTVTVKIPLTRFKNDLKIVVEQAQVHGAAKLSFGTRYELISKDNVKVYFHESLGKEAEAFAGRMASFYKARPTKHEDRVARIKNQNRFLVFSKAEELRARVQTSVKDPLLRKAALKAHEALQDPNELSAWAEVIRSELLKRNAFTKEGLRELLVERAHARRILKVVELDRTLTTAEFSTLLQSQALPIDNVFGRFRFDHGVLTHLAQVDYVSKHVESALGPEGTAKFVRYLGSKEAEGMWTTLFDSGLGYPTNYSMPDIFSQTVRLALPMY